MKNFFDNIFKPYIFPIILLIIGAFLKAGENLTSVTSFFSDSTNKFINFFSRQFYLWEVLLYLVIVYLLSFLYKRIFKRKSKKEKLMYKAIKAMPREFPVQINGTTDTYLFKYELDVSNKNYEVSKLRPYCQNCGNGNLRMADKYYGDYRCNCGRVIDFRLWEDVKTRIISELEELESQLQ